MITMEGLIGVLALCATFFGLGINLKHSFLVNVLEGTCADSLYSTCVLDDNRLCIVAAIKGTCTNPSYICSDGHLLESL